MLTMVLGLYQRPEQKAENQESESESHSVPSDSLRPHGLYSPWNSPGQNTRVGRCSLLQGIFPTQGSNPGLPYCRQILYQLGHKGSPRILEWVADPFSGIFLTQGLNQGLLHCRRTLYQMGYEGSLSWPRNTQRNKRQCVISYACMCIGAH